MPKGVAILARSLSSNSSDLLARALLGAPVRFRRFFAAKRFGAVRERTNSRAVCLAIRYLDIQSWLARGPVEFSPLSRDAGIFADSQMQLSACALACESAAA